MTLNDPHTASSSICPCYNLCLVGFQPLGHNGIITADILIKFTVCDHIYDIIATTIVSLCHVRITLEYCTLSCRTIWVFAANKTNYMKQHHPESVNLVK